MAYIALYLYHVTPSWSAAARAASSAARRAASSAVSYAPPMGDHRFFVLFFSERTDADAAEFPSQVPSQLPSLTPKPQYITNNTI